MELNTTTPIQKLKEKRFIKRGIELWMKREDLIHPVVSGNKFRKLKYNLKEAKKLGYSKLITFGGAFSNHIIAVACAAAENNFESIGIVRGEESSKNNSTLRQASEFGMKLYFVSRSEYSLKESEAFKMKHVNKFGKVFLIPEGGANKLGVKGVSEICSELNQFTHIIVPVGTGTTLAGIVTGMDESQTAIGISVLKARGHLEEIVSQFVEAINKSWKINHEFHFGGYAKHNQDLISFINRFRCNHQIALDPIYTGKMMFGLYELLQQDFFPRGSKVVAIHTGGLQGIAGFNQRFGNLIKSD